MLQIVSFKNKITSYLTNIIAWTNLLTDMYFVGMLGHKTDIGGKKVYLCALIVAHGSMNDYLFLNQKLTCNAYPL